MRYHFEDCALDTDKRELRRGGDPVSITPQVFDLLEYLILNRERVVSKDDLIHAIWKGRIVSDAAVTTRLNAARGAIGDSGEKQHLIRTILRKGFRFVGAVREDRGPATAIAGKTSLDGLRAVLTLPDKPSIAVLPFTNLSSDQEQQYFADGIVEDIITELSRFSGFLVIARNSSFQYKGKATDVRQVGRELGVHYVLEGSVRRSRNRLRIGAQLIDAATGAHRWAEHYDRKLEEVFVVQDEVVRTITTILARHIWRAETERARAKPPTSWQAYDYYLQAVDALWRTFNSSFCVDDLFEARRLIQCSIAIDPNYARSYALLANAHIAAWTNSWSSDFLNPSVLEDAHQLARKAVQLDSNLTHAHASLGEVLMHKQEHEASVAEFERAFALNPNYVDWRFGFALVRAGDSRRAVHVLEDYMRLDPFYEPASCSILGFAYYMVKQYSRALLALRECVSRAPRLRGGHVWLAATYAQLGRFEEARAEVAEVLRLQPNYTIATIGRRMVTFKSAKDDKFYFEGLRKAGLPD